MNHVIHAIYAFTQCVVAKHALVQRLQLSLARVYASLCQQLHAS
jgi:hypothetical protein